MDTKATKTYIAMERIEHDHRNYAIGEDIELTEDQAKTMLKLGSVVVHGDKLAAKVVEANKEKDEQDIKDARAKLEARARGEEPNNLGRVVVAPGITAPMPLDPGYRIVGVNEKTKDGSPNPAPGTKAAPAAKAGVPVGVPVAPRGRAGVASGKSVHVTTGKPASKAGKAPVGGKKAGK